MMFQIGFTLPPPFFFSSVLYCVFTIFFSPSFSYNMSVSKWAFHCGALGSRFLLNCSITVRVLLYILSRQTVQLVTQYIINTMWCCLYFHPKKYNHKYATVIFQWCEALLERCNYMLPGLSPLASLWLQSPLATQYTHSAVRSEDEWLWCIKWNSSDLNLITLCFAAPQHWKEEKKNPKSYMAFVFMSRYPPPSLFVSSASNVNVWPMKVGSRAHLIRQIKRLLIPEIYHLPWAVSNPSLISRH